MAGAGSRHTAELVAPVVPPAPSTVDLHTHTRRSDGVLEPAELVAQAHAAGVRLLAITDHDSLQGVRELLAAGTIPPALDLLPGVEINAVAGAREGFWEGELHVLGLGVDPDDESFEAALAAQRNVRRERFARILTRLRELAMPVDDAVEAMALGDEDALGRPTVARALVAKGHATSVEDAFARWLGHGRPAYMPRGGLGPRAAIGTIRAAGGLPVLAHFAEAPNRISTLRELCDTGLGGLEVYYRTWDQPTVDAVATVARELALIPTGGSDYHGDLGPYAEAHAGLWVPAAVGDEVRAALRVG